MIGRYRRGIRFKLTGGAGVGRAITEKQEYHAFELKFRTLLLCLIYVSYLPALLTQNIRPVACRCCSPRHSNNSSIAPAAPRATPRAGVKGETLRARAEAVAENAQGHGAHHPRAGA